MTSEQITYCAVMGLLGITAQVCVKVRNLKIRASAGNAEFNISSYFKDDWPAILLSCVAVAAMIIGLDEVLGYKPEVAKFMKWAFLFVGYTGASLLNAFFSKAEKKIMGTIDEKTNIADNKTT